MGQQLLSPLPTCPPARGSLAPACAHCGMAKAEAVCSAPYRPGMPGPAQSLAVLKVQMPQNSLLESNQAAFTIRKQLPRCLSSRLNVAKLISCLAYRNYDFEGNLIHLI